MILIANGAKLEKPPQDTVLTAGMADAVYCEFELSPQWDGMNIIAVFTNGTVTRDVLLTNRSCAIPAEVLADSGKCVYVGLHGTNGSGTVLPTERCLVGVVKEGTDPSGDAAAAPTPSLIDELVSVVQSVRSDADNGVFDGAVFSPTIDTDGNLSWSNDKELAVPSTVNIMGPRGYSGMVPLVSALYSQAVTASANVKTDIGELDGDCEITLGDGVEGYDNEWDIVIRMGENEYDLVLPPINWIYGMAPEFGAGSVTDVCLYYIGDTLCGRWESV